MSAFPTGQLLYGLWYALIGIAFWSSGFVVAYYLYKRWGADEGPQSRRDSP